MAYWGFFGGVNVPAPGWFYALLNTLALLAAAGLLLEAARRLLQRHWPSPDTTFRLALVALWPLIVMAGLIRWTLMTVASQGRLLFPAIAALSYLMVLGLECWAPLLAHAACCVLRVLYYVLRIACSVRHVACCVFRFAWPISCPWSQAAHSRTHTQMAGQETRAGRLTQHATRLTSYVLRFTFPALLAALAAWVPFAVIAPAYAPPPLLSPAQEAAIPHRLDLSFAGQLQLLGYRIEPTEVTPGQNLAVTLYWRALAPMPEDYMVFVHLLNSRNQILAQRDVYLGGSKFPTTLWQPGNAIAETYRLHAPETADRPIRLRVEAGVYRLETGEALAIHDRAGAPRGAFIRFGQLTHDEYFVSAEAAKAGVRMVNESASDPLVILKHFGPGASG